MKVNIIGVDPIYVSKERADAIAKAIQAEVPIILIDGHYVKPTSISSITPEEEPPSRYGAIGNLYSYVPTLMPPEPKGDGKGFERYKSMRNKLKI